MIDFDYDKLQFLRKYKKSKLDLLRYIRLNLTKHNILKLKSEYNNIDDFEFKLREESMLLNYCGDFIADKQNKSFEKYVEERFYKESGKTLKLKK